MNFCEGFKRHYYNLGDKLVFSGKMVFTLESTYKDEKDINVCGAGVGGMT